MRHFLSSAFVVLALTASLSATAQTKTTPKPAGAVTTGASDRFLMQNGSVVLVQNGRPTPLTQNVRLGNGTKVNYKSGIVELPGGKITTLQEGDYVTSKGEIVFATPASAAAARGQKAEPGAKFDPYVERGAALSPADVDARLTTLSTRLDLMAQKIQLLNQKISLLSVNAQRPTDTAQLDQQIQQLEQQLQQLK
ncbi:hypothetical protein FY528_18045 [Hymenobacter lutimineralis]|uniref:DUF6799 domain-containing protein n=1 Tax=Hymenobacter lutimineralis TaxID=2606448 RepID=A0A5D6US92_9BACT|nr:DUF6799 domain-containing protein [Hymenobacter lutimineralis]TYZ06416.1 hypothetical protein FY528_18045 [Hymenobacter lutimineralis]